MGAIEYATQINYILVILGLFAILFAIKEIIEIFSYFKMKFRIKTGADEDKETLEERITILEKHDSCQYRELTKISNCVEEIKKNIVSKEIDDIRWELLDFCSALTSGRKYNREAFAHIFKTYEKYEKILEDNGMTNGFVEESMNAVKEIYHDKLKNGEFNN